MSKVSGRQKVKARKAAQRAAKLAAWVAECVEDERRILYGDPDAAPPVGVIYAQPTPRAA